MPWFSFFGILLLLYVQRCAPQSAAQRQFNEHQFFPVSILSAVCFKKNVQMLFNVVAFGQNDPRWPEILFMVIPEREKETEIRRALYLFIHLSILQATILPTLSVAENIFNRPFHLSDDENYYCYFIR